MEINKLVAQSELRILGGTPKVNQYWNHFEDKNIDILKCLDVPQKGVQSCATIGLNNTDIGLQSGGKKLRVELLGACDIAIENYGNIFASIAFDIMDLNQCYPGYIVKNTINQYIPGSDMKHILLTDPFLWENTENVLVEDICVTWLMTIPISEQEYDYARKLGVDALEKLFEENAIDILNMYRKSII